MKPDCAPSISSPATPIQSSQLRTSRLWYIAGLVTLVGAFGRLAAAPADDRVTEGRQLLVERDLAGAHAQFNAALALTPGHAAANALAAVTRVLLLPQHPAVSNALDRLGVSSEGRDIYDWTADFARDDEGNVMLPEDLTTTEAIALLRSNVLPVVRTSMTNLSRITSTSFLIQLSEEETGIDAVTLDYGDIQLLRVGLHMVEFTILTLNAHNLAVRIDSALTTNAPTFERFLDDYPDLLTIHSTADLTASKTALQNAIARYQAASSFIRGRVPNADRLFMLTEEDVEEERDFRTMILPKIKSALDGPVVVDRDSGARLNLSRYFRGSFALRDLLPQFEDGYYVLGTLPDPTFGGTLTGVDAESVEDALIDEFGYIVRDDVARPVVVISNPPPNARFTGTTATASLRITGGASDAASEVALVEYRLNGSDLSPVTGVTEWFADVELVPGTNTFAVRARDTAGNPSLTTIRTLVYVRQAELELEVEGGGRVTGGSDGQLLFVGRSYRLTATPSNGWVFAGWSGTFGTGEPRLDFTMPPDGAAITARFIPTPFPAVRGTYVGLFCEEAGVRHESSGYFSLMLTDRGRFSGYLLFGGRRVSLSGALWADGKATNVVTFARTNHLGVELMVDLAGSNQINGRIVAAQWTARLQGDRDVYDGRTTVTSLATNYTVAILGSTNPAALPGGDGVGTVKVTPNGTVKFSGTLADNTPAAQATSVSQGGHWPLYLSLYGGKGSLLSWVNFADGTNTDFSGAVSWIKPALPTRPPYANGFTNDTSIVGSIYPAPGTGRALDMTNGTATLTGGNLAAPLVSAVALGPNNVITNLSTNQLVLRITKSSGLVSGSIKVPGSTRAKPIKGVILRKARTGVGFFIGTTESGRLELRAE